LSCLESSWLLLLLAFFILVLGFGLAVWE